MEASMAEHVQATVALRPTAEAPPEAALLVSLRLRVRGQAFGGYTGFPKLFRHEGSMALTDAEAEATYLVDVRDGLADPVDDKLSPCMIARQNSVKFVGHEAAPLPLDLT